MKAIGLLTSVLERTVKREKMTERRSLKLLGDVKCEVEDLTL